MGAELAADSSSELLDLFYDGLAQAAGQSEIVVQIVAADVGGDHEPRGNGKPQPGHFTEIAALAAEEDRH